MDPVQTAGAVTEDPFGSFSDGAFAGAFGGPVGPSGDANTSGDQRTQIGGNAFNYKSGSTGMSSFIMPALILAGVLGAVYLMRGA